MNCVRLFLVSTLLFFLAEFAHAQERIQIASFNIAEFGEGNHPQTRDLDFIAKMLVGANLDLIAIQEVGVRQQAENQLDKLLAEMNQEQGSGEPRYFSYLTPVTGDERYAVIYRSPVVLDDGPTWLDEDKDPGNPRAGGTTYFRIPVAIPFHAGNFDFVVVITHLTWGKPDRRRAEFNALRRFLREEDPSEGDWIVLGDMNRYGKYSKSATNKAFDRLLVGNNWKARYRFPLLEAITDPHDMKVFKASRDEHSTTVAKSKNIYDQFIITAGAFREFETTGPVFGQHVGIIPFDMEPPFNTLIDHNAVKFSVSDHRPIWISFRTDLADDD